MITPKDEIGVVVVNASLPRSVLRVIIGESANCLGSSIQHGSICYDNMKLCALTFKGSGNYSGREAVSASQSTGLLDFANACRGTTRLHQSLPALSCQLECLRTRSSSLACS